MTNKNLPLFCKVGDVVEFKINVTTTSWDDGSEEIVAGARYEVVDLVGSGWNLRLLSGKGAKEVRLLNSDSYKYLLIRNSD
jgi:hypothetical protein